MPDVTTLCQETVLARDRASSSEQFLKVRRRSPSHIVAPIEKSVVVGTCVPTAPPGRPSHLSPLSSDFPVRTTVDGVDSSISHVDPPREPAAYGFSHDIRVRFAETDAMGIVHHSNYLLFLEETRVEYLRSIGHPYTANREAGFDAAVLECRVRYLAPVRFDDVVTVHLRLAQTTRATFSIEYLLTVDGRPTTIAATQHAFVTAGGKPRRLPEWLRAI